MDEKSAALDVVEKKALHIVEKHIEAMGLELADLAPEAAAAATENASMLVKLIAANAVPQLVVTAKALIPKLDLDKDGV